MANPVIFLLLLLPVVCTESRWQPSAKDECCVSSKLNVGAKKANSGRTFFRRLSSSADDADAYKEINPENMCNLIHFLIQQASLNRKPITFTKGCQSSIRLSLIDWFVCSLGMFVIFDSSEQIFPRLMKAKNEQKSGDDSQYAGYLQRLKHMTVQGFSQLFGQKKDKSEVIPSDTFIYVRGDESSHFHEERGPKDDRTREYPAYGMDIPGACQSLLLSLSLLRLQ